MNTTGPGCRQAWKRRPIYNRPLAEVRAELGCAEDRPKAAPRPVTPSMDLFLVGNRASIAVPGQGLVVLEAEGDPMDAVRELVRRFDNGGTVYLMRDFRTEVLREATR